MALTIDVDTGGTFTDGFFADDQEFRMVKVETTPHDLTVCFKECIEEGARELGFDSPGQMLAHADSIKFSTTTATNTMIQKSGLKLGLIVTDGHEEDLYSEDGSEPAVWALLSRKMVAGISAGRDEEGNFAEPDLEEVRAAVRKLLTSGARALVVCLRGSFSDPSAEEKVKEMILADYPKHYLGAVPVFLSSELCSRPEDHLRTSATVVNAYLHRELARYLYKAEEDLRQQNCRRPLLIVHSTGGAARVAKTTALHTYNSGPVAGFLGSYSMSRLYDLENVVSVDMGGTSTDIGIIARGRYSYEFVPRVGGIAVNVPMIEINAIGGGGGSVAWLDEGGDLRVGPQSAGALPGPACYGLGGEEPTVTDADLVLGYLNPERFLGGRRKLDRNKAVAAIEDKISGPLGMTAVEAAANIKKKVDSIAADAIGKEIDERGLEPGEFSLFVYGGAGATHCCGFGTDFSSLFTFPYSAVFSAYGASTLDVMHVYERIVPVDLPGADLDDFNGIVRQMSEVALRDLRGEGFSRESAVLELELQMEHDGRSIMVRSPHLTLNGEDQVGDLLEAFCRERESMEGRESAEVSGVEVKAVRLLASSPIEHTRFPRFGDEGDDPSKARIGSRGVCWNGSFDETVIYERGLLKCGNVVTGPAIIEQDDTTCVLPAGRKLTVDSYLTGIIEKT